MSSSSPVTALDLLQAVENKIQFIKKINIYE